MDSEETTEWIVNELNNNRYRNFLELLSRYKEPHDLLSDLKARSFHIRDNPPMKSDDARKSDKSESDPGGLNCYTCKVREILREIAVKIAKKLATLGHRNS